MNNNEKPALPTRKRVRTDAISQKVLSDKVMEMTLQGSSISEISKALDISPRTVEKKRKEIKHILRLADTSQIVRVKAQYAGKFMALYGQAMRAFEAWMDEKPDIAHKFFCSAVAVLKESASIDMAYKDIKLPEVKLTKTQDELGNYTIDEILETGTTDIHEIVEHGSNPLIEDSQ
ncbi:MAG: LuxR C-terminal-related transcriptional regulator [Candidatus Obscuribacterales bacterium]|nr:LuxR C-terminal-related transcriptional regulator [Candidatus Obscuribacterales bacterium]